MAKQNVRRGREGKLDRVTRAEDPEKEPSQSWNDQFRIWMRG